MSQVNPPRPSLYDRCFKDKDGHVVLGQAANLPIIVCVISALVALIPLWPLRVLGATVAFGTLFTWAWLELFDGVNYFRRALGLMTLLVLTGGVVAVFASGLIKR